MDTLDGFFALTAIGCLIGFFGERVIEFVIDVIDSLKG